MYIFGTRGYNIISGISKPEVHNVLFSFKYILPLLNWFVSLACAVNFKEGLTKVFGDTAPSA